MVRTSKFSFPLPGRRQKSAPEALVVSGPLSKAQKILGNGGINIDSPTFSKDQSKHWEITSASAVTVTVSESSCSYGTGHTWLGVVRERDENVLGEAHDDGGGTWETESGALPQQQKLRAGS